MNWKDITVKQYYDIVDIISKDLSPIEANIEFIKIIFNVDAEDIPYVKMVYYLNQLDFLKEPYEGKKPKKKYVVNDMTFNAITNIDGFTTAQYIDYQELIKREDYKHLMNCFFIKEGEKYGDNDYSDLLWESLPFTDYADVLFFLRSFFVNYTKATLRYSRKMMKKLIKMEKDPIKKKELEQQVMQLNEVDWDELVK